MKSLVLISTMAVLLFPTLASAKDPSLVNRFARGGAMVTSPQKPSFGHRLGLIRTNVRAARHDSTRPATHAILRICHGKPRLADPLDIAITPLVWSINVTTGVVLGVRGQAYQQYYGR